MDSEYTPSRLLKPSLLRTGRQSIMIFSSVSFGPVHMVVCLSDMTSPGRPVEWGEPEARICIWRTQGKLKT